MKLSQIVLAVAAALGAAAALAQPPAQPPAGHPMMMRLDTNSDGQVSREEFNAGHAQRFAALDTNGDGKLTPEEMAAGAPRHRHGMNDGQGMGNGQGMMNGQPMMKGQGMSDEERAQRHQQRMQQFFDAADTNGDGVLSRAEFDAMGMKRFGHMDANGDGRIGPDEMGHGRGMHRMRSDDDAYDDASDEGQDD